MQSNKHIRVLMVEDSESDASFNLRALEKAGFEIHYELVCTESEMSKALNCGQFDLVLSDHNMPQFDSAGALKVFKASGLDVPFIIVSGAIGEEIAVDLMKKGAQDYVMKGNLARLAPLVERELKEAEARRQRKQSESRLLVSEERFRQVAEIAGEMIWETDANMRYTYVNPVAEAVTGYKPEEIVGKRAIYDFFPSEACQGYRALWKEYFDNRRVVKGITSTRVRKDGEIVVLETSATPVVDSQGILTGYRGTDTDITERKHMEVEIGDLYQKEKTQRQKLQEEAEVKNLFINVLAHELRNPLTAIVVSSELLQETQTLKEDIKDELTANIYASAKIMTQHLEELLDLARYSKGVIVFNKHSLNIPDFLRQTASRFSPNLEKRGQVLDVEISPQLGKFNVDESRLDQVITNLLSNAGKYSPANAKIILSANLAQGGFLIEVTDFGVGISAEEQKKLFQPYYRAAANNLVPGIGLGLAISNKIVEAHDGKIGIQSVPGKGSPFSVFIPG